jgi:hypothetical protein
MHQHQNQRPRIPWALSGSVPISIVEHDGVCSIRAGRYLVKSPETVSIWWITAAMASPVASAARLYVGPGADLSAATAALHGSAAMLRATLTPDDIAIGRASAAVTRLDAMIEAMRRDGTLQEFNARYKRGRAAALARGRASWDSGLRWRASKPR